MGLCGHGCRFTAWTGLRVTHTTPTHEGIYLSRPPKRQINTELDLHGVRVEEALDRIDGFPQ